QPTSFGPRGGPLDMNTELRQALERVARRFRRVRLWSALALCWLGCAVVTGVMLTILSRTGQTPTSGRWLLSLLAIALVGGAVLATWAMQSVRDLHWVARRIEAKYPDLNAGLLAAVEQPVERPAEKLGYLQTAVIRQALDHHRRHLWDQTVSPRQLQGAKLAHA